jgi:DUF1365 family protein
MYWLYLDLDEVPTLLERRILRGGRFGSASYRRGDHLGPAELPPGDAVRELVLAQTGMALHGPIHLLTQLRTFGVYFSPLNLFYCFDQAGDEVSAVVAEVSNTPWNERHCYVLWEGNREDHTRRLAFCHDKQFHVSPFMPMTTRYRWRLTRPGRRLAVRIDIERDGEPLFTTHLTLSRRELTRGQLLRCQLRFPLPAVQTLAAIYFQALRLWTKKCPFYPHPKRRASITTIVR